MGTFLRWRRALANLFTRGPVPHVGGNRRGQHRVGLRRSVSASVEPVVAREMGRRKLTFRFPPRGERLIAVADGDKLRRVLLNLVTNAIKFTDPGGTISIDAAVAEDMVCISVTDSGIGIPSESLRRVFEPFYQVNQGETRKYPGLGLGLSIVREAVSAWAGA